MSRLRTSLGPGGNVYETLALAADVVVVNACLLVASLPVVTAGEAMRRATVVTAQLAADEGSRPARTFFYGFGRDGAWKTPTAWWIASLLLGAVAAWELRALFLLGGGGSLAAGAGVVAGLVVLACWGAWLVALAAISAPTPGTASRAAALALAHPWRTLGAGAALVWPVVVLVVVPSAWTFLLVYHLIIGGALAWYVVGLILRPVLTPAAS